MDINFTSAELALIEFMTDVQLRLKSMGDEEGIIPDLLKSISQKLKK